MQLFVIFLALATSSGAARSKGETLDMNDVDSNVIEDLSDETSEVTEKMSEEVEEELEYETRNFGALYEIAKNSYLANDWKNCVR